MNFLSRRQFIRAAGAAAVAAPVALQVKSSRAEVGANDRIRLGVVGYGKRGTGDLAEFLRNPEVECAVVCDVDDAHLAAAVKHVQGQSGRAPETAKDFRRVMERDDLDALLVATPDHWHALPTILACQTGRDVYVEKPFARTIDEGRAMVEAAGVHKRIVQMGSQWRSAAHFQEAAAFVQSGKLGKIRFVRAWAYNQWEDPLVKLPDTPVPAGVDYEMWLGHRPQRAFNENRFHRNFRWYWDYAGGLMTDWGVHMLNFCQSALPPEMPARVSAVGGVRVLDGIVETPDTQSVLYEFPTYTLAWEHQLEGGLPPNGRSHGVWISGEYGAVVADSGGWEVIPEPGDTSLEASKSEPTPDSRPEHVRNFLDCMKSRAQPVQHPEISHHVTTLAHLGNIALRAGREILWDAAAERITNDPAADALVGEPYRDPWTLPYSRRA